MELRRLWEMAKVSLPDEAITYDVANSLGNELDQKGQYQEVKVLYLAALEGRRGVLGEEHKDTLDTLHNLGCLPCDMKEHGGAIDYYQQALRVQEKVFGKAHPETLNTITNIGMVFMEEDIGVHKGRGEVHARSGW